MVCIGTARECAEALGVDVKTVRWYAYSKRAHEAFERRGGTVVDVMD